MPFDFPTLKITVTIYAMSNTSRFISSSSVVSLFARTSAHESLRSDIEQVRSCFFDLLLACTFIVLAGVVIEGVEHLLSTGRPYANTETGEFNPTPLLEWHKKLARLGWLLVIVGVLGEGLFEAATSWTDGLLQGFSNTLLAITTEQARSAAMSAKIAHQEADAVKLDADEIDKRLNSASARLTQMLEALRQPSLSEKERKELSAELAKCPNRDTPVLVRFTITSNLGILVSNALQSAGFTKLMVQPERTTWIGVSIHGPFADVDVANCIGAALSKRVAIWGPQGVSDPPGYPVTISLGETPMGKLPK